MLLEDLDRDEPAQAYLATPVDNADPTRSEALEHLVATVQHPADEWIGARFGREDLTARPQRQRRDGARHDRAQPKPASVVAVPELGGRQTLRLMVPSTNVKL